MSTRRNFLKSLLILGIMNPFKIAFGNNFLIGESFKHSVKPKPIRKIIVIGLGGCGCRTIDYSIQSSLKGVDFIAADTDFSSLQNSLALTQIPLWTKTNEGQGLKGSMDLGREAILRNKGKFYNLIRGNDMVFIIAGLGGGTGTGGGPILAQISREAGALTFGVVTTPFPREEEERFSQAACGLKILSEKTDSLILIPNRHLIPQATDMINQQDLYRKSIFHLSQAVRGLCDLILSTEVFEQDYARLWQLKGQIGSVGIGWGRGEKRASQATEMALTSPLLEKFPPTEATNLILIIKPPPDFSFEEVIDCTTTSITKMDFLGNENSNLYWWTLKDSQSTDKVRITLYGFQERKKELLRFVA